jgi:hypothetical protein
MTLADDILQHQGVKGMHWGVRREEDSSGHVTGPSVSKVKTAVKKEISERTGTQVVVRTKPGKGVRTVGGNKQNASQDAIDARTAEQKAKKSTLDSLSNKELQSLVTRMNLEQQYRNLAVNEDRTTAGEKYANKLLDAGGDKVASKAGPLGKPVKLAIDQARKNQNKALNSGKANNKKDKKN